MKIYFRAPEEQNALRDIIWRAIMQTEGYIFNPAYYHEGKIIMKMLPYMTQAIMDRRTCFEILEEKDPNEEFINSLYKENMANEETC